MLKINSKESTSLEYLQNTYVKTHSVSSNSELTTFLRGLYSHLYMTSVARLSTLSFFHKTLGGAHDHS